MNYTLFDNIRYAVNIFYRMCGVGVLSFLFLLVYRRGIFDMGVIAFFLWLGLYFLFAAKFVNDIKKREHWGKIRRNFSVAIVRAPMTVLNLIFIYAVLFSEIRVPMLLWVSVLLAWSIFPVYFLIDRLEKKQCS